MAGDHRPDIFQLHQPDGGIDIVHVVLVARLGHVHLGARRIAVYAEPAQAPAARQVARVAAGKHAAVDRGEMLDRLQRVHHVFGPAADRQSGIARAERMRRVLDHGHTVAFGDGADRSHGGRDAAIVHHHDRARAWRNLFLDRGGRQVAVARIDIGPYHARAGMQNGEIGWFGGHRGGDDFVARTGTGKQQCDMQRRGAGIERKHIRLADECAEALLEFGHRRAFRNLAAVEHLAQARQQRGFRRHEDFEQRYLPIAVTHACAPPLSSPVQRHEACPESGASAARVARCLVFEVRTDHPLGVETGGHG